MIESIDLHSIENIDVRSSDGTLNFSDEAEITIDEINFEFEQKSKLRGKYRKLTVFNGDYCFQAIKNRHKRKYKYRVALAYLDPRPVRERHISWKWLYATLGFSLMVAITVYSVWLANWLNPSIYILELLVIEITATLICLLLLIHNTYDKIIFETQYGRVKLIELLNRYPNKKVFRGFVSQFILQIKQSAKNKGYLQSGFLAQELVELRRLKEETVLGKEEYELAKMAILKHEGFQAKAA
jgi:hypothetical protein